MQENAGRESRWPNDANWWKLQWSTHPSSEYTPQQAMPLGLHVYILLISWYKIAWSTRKLHLFIFNLAKQSCQLWCQSGRVTLLQICTIEECFDLVNMVVCVLVCACYDSIQQSLILPKWFLWTRYNRAHRLQRLRWQLGAILPEDIKGRLHPSEKEFVKGYSDVMSSYMTKLDLDLTVVSLCHFASLVHYIWAA